MNTNDAEITSFTATDGSITIDAVYPSGSIDRVVIRGTSRKLYWHHHSHPAGKFGTGCYGKRFAKHIAAIVAASGLK